MRTTNARPTNENNNEKPDRSKDKRVSGRSTRAETIARERKPLENRLRLVGCAVEGSGLGILGKLITFEPAIQRPSFFPLTGLVTHEEETETDERFHIPP